MATGIQPNDNAPGSGGGSGGNSSAAGNSSSVGGDPHGNKTYVPGYTQSAGAGGSVTSERNNLLLEEQHQDLHHEQLETLGSYLSSLTSGKTKTSDTAGPDNPGYGGSEFRNHYSINDGLSQFQLKDEEGYPAEIVTAGQTDAAETFQASLDPSVEVGVYGNDKSFPPRNESLRGSLERYSNSGMFDGADPTDTTLSDILDKMSRIWVSLLSILV